MITCTNEETNMANIQNYRKICPRIISATMKAWMLTMYKHFATRETSMTLFICGGCDFLPENSHSKRWFTNK